MIPTSALTGVGGIAFGFLLSLLHTWVTDSRRWKREDELRIEERKREDATRHHPERLVAYRNLYSIIRIEMLGIKFDQEAEKHEVDYAQLNQGMQSIHSCCAEVMLLTSSDEVSQTCESVQNQCMNLAWAFTTKSDVQLLREQFIKNQIEGLIPARESFLEAARRELGISD